MSNQPPTAAELGLGMDVRLSPEQRVDWDNWTVAPYNRWSFQRVQQLTRTARISSSPEPVPLDVALVDVGGVEFADMSGKATNVESMLERTWTDGFLVMHRGRIISERYFNSMRPDTLHLLMSCSKSLTSTLVGVAVAEGALAPSSLLTTYVPELADTAFAGATVQQALDMRVGIDFEEDYEDLNGEWRRCEIATGWREPDPDYEGPREMVRYMQTLTDSVGPHGDVFHYQSILTDALGVCLERATGRSFVDFFAERIWQPMGAEQDLVTIVEGSGIAVFEGGFNCCLRDFARFARLICEGGIAHGQQLVPVSWINECRYPNDALVDAFARSEYGEALAGYAYHNKWWVRDPQRGVIMALGIHGQTLYIDPDREFLVAKFSSQPAPVDIAMALDQVRGFEAIAEYLA